MVMMLPTTEITPMASLYDFPSISLTQLQDEAAFLIRRDRKYIVPVDVLAELLSKSEPGTRALAD